LIPDPAKAENWYELFMQFGLALRSGTFLLDAEVRSTADKSSALAECARTV